MIEAAEFTYCILDDLPIEESKMYQTLILAIGEKKARRWTETVEIKLPKGDP